jgi:bifunctional DNA-binding transcriptional regulator/antitoxin component of YhaV-PrlF toxin-antitoxin module
VDRTLTSFRASLTRNVRGYWGVVLPREASERLGTRRQVSAVVSVAGVRFQTVLSPTGDGGHFLPIKKAVREKLGISSGDSVEVAIHHTVSAPEVAVPQELLEALTKSDTDRKAWESLTPAARRIASTWIGRARGHEVRAWRIKDVLRRARRYYRGEGPFYPTKEDQAKLARPRRST